MRALKSLMLLFLLGCSREEKSSSQILMCLSASRQSSQGSGLAWDLLLHWAVIRAPRATSARRNHSCRASLVRTTAELNYSPILDGNWRNEEKDLLLRETLKKYKVVGKKEEWILVFVVMPSWTLNEDDNDLHATCFLSTVAHWSKNIIAIDCKKFQQ